MPLKAAGMRIDPPWSPPIAISASPVATTTALPDDEWQQQAPGVTIDVRKTQTNGTNGNTDDGNLVRDDSDVASVDGSANDEARADPLFGGSY